jgi:galactitol-specific phosphotransferase system IIC component
MQPYRRYLFIAIVFVALGITFSTTLGDSLNSLGTVCIAVGGLFLIIGLSKKRKEEE